MALSCLIFLSSCGDSLISTINERDLKVELDEKISKTITQAPLITSNLLEPAKDWLKSNKYSNKYLVEDGVVSKNLNANYYQVTFSSPNREMKDSEDKLVLFFNNEEVASAGFINSRQVESNRFALDFKNLEKVPVTSMVLDASKHTVEFLTFSKSSDNTCNYKNAKACVEYQFTEWGWGSGVLAAAAFLDPPIGGAVVVACMALVCTFGYDYTSTAQQ